MEAAQAMYAALVSLHPWSKMHAGRAEAAWGQLTRCGRHTHRAPQLAAHHLPGQCLLQQLHTCTMEAQTMFVSCHDRQGQRQGQRLHPHPTILHVHVSCQPHTRNNPHDNSHLDCELGRLGQPRRLTRSIDRLQHLHLTCAAGR